MKSYAITRPDAAAREELLEALPRIADLSEALGELVCVAWTTMWKSSTHTRLAEAPFCLGSTYPLVKHVGEVAEAGLALAARAEAMWGMKVDMDRLLAILLLHDIDKLLLYTREGTQTVASEVHGRIQHGVLGALLLAELGADEPIVAAVSTHAANAPFRGVHPEEFILHYADMFCADYALFTSDLPPFFAKGR